MQWSEKAKDRRSKRYSISAIIFQSLTQRAEHWPRSLLWSAAQSIHRFLILRLLAMCLSWRHSKLEIVTTAFDHFFSAFSHFASQNSIWFGCLFSDCFRWLRTLTLLISSLSAAELEAEDDLLDEPQVSGVWAERGLIMTGLEDRGSMTILTTSSLGVSFN